MADEAKSARGCFKVGCFGCLGCLVVVLLVFLVLATVGLTMGVPDEDLVSQEYSRGFPEPDRFAVEPRDLEPARPGRVVLDLSMGQFVIEPGPPGDPIRIEADYDAGSYELIEGFEPSGESGWVYRVEFGLGISWVRKMFHIEDADNRIRIIIPRDVPFVLEGDVGVGESDFELGGLWVTGVELDTGIGEHAVSFAEPVPQPMDHFRIDGSTGELRVSGLGNASPAEVSIYQNIGELHLDLGGAWRQDADVRASHRIGALNVYLPDENIGVELLRSRLTIGERDVRAVTDRSPPPPGAPTVRLSLASTLGELRVNR